MLLDAHPVLHLAVNCNQCSQYNAPHTSAVKKPSTNKKGSATPKKQVGFVLSRSPSPDRSKAHAEHSGPEIPNLCFAIAQARAQACLGFLRDEKRRRYALYSHVETAPSIRRTVVTLETLLAAQKSSNSESSSNTDLNASIWMLRSNKYRVAIILAVTLLQLHATPWLCRHISKRTVFFVCINGVIDVSRLYIAPDHFGEDNSKKEPTRPLTASCTSPSSSSSAAAAPPFSSSSTVMANVTTCQAALLALGVLLLELSFGYAIEDHTKRTAYLGPDGKPNTFTDMATARDWQKDAMPQSGLKYAEAVRKCILCAFSQPKADLSDLEFQNAVYSEVIEPLEDTMRFYEEGE